MKQRLELGTKIVDHDLGIFGIVWKSHFNKGRWWYRVRWSDGRTNTASHMDLIMADQDGDVLIQD
jgi:hypothetical protein